MRCGVVWCGVVWCGVVPGGRLQLVLMRHPPPSYLSRLAGGGVGRRVGGGGIGSSAGGRGGLHATHYYHMHTSRGCVCLGAWGDRGTYAIIVISRLCREASLKGLKDQRHSTPLSTKHGTKNLAPLAPRPPLSFKTQGGGGSHTRTGPGRPLGGVVWCGVVWCGVVRCAEGSGTRRQRPGCLAYGHSKTGRGVCVCVCKTGRGVCVCVRTLGYAPLRRLGAPQRLVGLVQGRPGDPGRSTC